MYTLVIHKHKGPATSITPNGTEITGQAAATLPEAVQEAVFAVGLIDGYDFNNNSAIDSDEGFDLTTEQGWRNAQRLSTMSATQIASAHKTAVTGSPFTTNSSGIATVADQLPGLYYVEETYAPPGYVPSAPFLVTLPMTNPAGTSWMDTVHVYPKNNKMNVEKTVNYDYTFDTITYTLAADIPQIEPASSPVNKYVLTDTLDSRLTFNPATGWGAAALVCGTGENATSTPLGLAADESEEVQIAAAGQVLTWTLTGTSPNYTDGGLGLINAKINANPAQLNCKVQVTFTVRANSLGAQIPNGGPTTPTNQTDLVWGTVPDGEQPPVVPPPVYIDLGGEALHKYDFSKSFGADGYNLAGAQFMLFKSDADARACNPVETQGVWSCQNNSVTPVQFYTNTVINGVVQNGFVDTNSNGVVDEGETGAKPNYAANAIGYVATSAADGTAYICGLRYGTYYVLEVKAPTGSGVNNGNFELLADPFAININSPLDFSAWTGVDNNIDDIGVANVPDNGGFQLPLTGGQGTMIFTILSLGIAAGGTAFALRHKARRTVA